MEATVEISPDKNVQKPKIIFDSTAITLIASNIVTIILAYIYHWNMINVLIIYWAQSVIIGIFTLIKLIDIPLEQFNTGNVSLTVNGQPITNPIWMKIYMPLFFAFHYGFFHLIYFIFLSRMFWKLTNIGYVFLAIGIFFLNHLYSFFINRKSDEAKMTNPSTVFSRPYSRIFPMHIILVFGLYLNPSGLGLVAFLTLKTIADFLTHLKEHA